MSEENNQPKFRVVLAGDSIIMNGHHLTNGFDENNNPIDWKIDGEPVSEQEFRAALGQPLP